MKVKIELKDFGEYIDDGAYACYNYGTKIKVNDIELECQNTDRETILTKVLEHLGYEVELIDK